ncbi:MAG: tRNA (adenosine(37)-N6)-threonylcarbamoyltransferase complex ATPase subunit type 1 TsaE [Lachnospiraceae bacterium]|nr:tRNA (adenosine(37)-N6)-threonylcarbamoyltransferase complex ATPase subunit type 1 TsaE [Lachnospiraceae bacterium]
MTTVLESRSVEETRRIAKSMGETAAAGDVFALNGDLGAGKTVFAKGFAEGLGFPYPEDVVSPTFTLLQIYEGGRLTLYHFDVYRMEDASEADGIGMDDYLFGDGVCLIEWAEHVEELLPAGRTQITITRDDAEGPSCRRITVTKNGVAGE